MVDSTDGTLIDVLEFRDPKTDGWKERQGVSRSYQSYPDRRDDGGVLIMAEFYAMAKCMDVACRSEMRKRK